MTRRTCSTVDDFFNLFFCCNSYLHNTCQGHVCRKFVTGICSTDLVTWAKAPQIQGGGSVVYISFPPILLQACEQRSLELLLISIPLGNSIVGAMAH
jgi:hypothetical protein